MLKKIFFIAHLCLLLPFVNQNVHAGVMLTDVQAYSSADATGTSLGNATAAHGYLLGNDVPNNGNLLELLNHGTHGPSTLTPTLLDPSQLIEISSTGMFSTLNMRDGTADGEIVDLIVGSIVVNDPGDEWIFQGKSDEANTPFNFISSGTTGTLEVTSPPGPLNGNFVLSLKAGNQYSVYAFANLEGVNSFGFTNLPEGLSHASLYTGTEFPPPPPPAPTVPEPGSLAIWCLGVFGSTVLIRRQRKTRLAK